MGTRRWVPHVCALVLYAAAAVAFTWPLPLHLSTHLTGAVDGDTGVYVWNQWVFRHEIVEHRTLPYFTGKIFALTSRANLGLHNYTTFANLLALPLMGTLGVVATFNVVYLLLTVTTAYAMFLLGRAVSGATAESWLAGLLFAWCPVLVTRGAGHFSLVAAAPLPVFMLLLLRSERRWRVRDGVALGLASAWAATSDVYYAVFCMLIAVLFVLIRVGIVPIAACRAEHPRKAVLRALDVLILSVLGLVVGVVISRGWQFTFLGTQVSVRGLHTPTLVMTALVLIRVALEYRPVVRLDPARLWPWVRVGAVAAAVAAIALSPVLFAVSERLSSGRLESPQILWRSSPPGVDLLAFVAPNPNHPLAPAALRAWLTPRPDAYLEQVASIPLVAIAAVLLAARRGWQVPRAWVVFTAAFALLALGPFVHVAGINTYVPGPWALLRYVPVIGLARSPSRFTIVAMMGVAVLFVLALRAVTGAAGRRRPLLLGATAVLLVAELLPIPRQLYSAAVPALYNRIASDPREEVRVLELPFGVRDGTRSIGNFTARSQFYQTVHGKPLLGGYLSRVSRRRLEDTRRYPVLDALITLSEGRPLPPERTAEVEQRGPAFLAAANLGYVVVDRSRASPALVAFATRVLRLEPLAAEGPLELYRPRP